MKNSKTVLRGLLVAGAMMTTGSITVSASSLLDFKNLGNGAEVRNNLSNHVNSKTNIEMNCANHDTKSTEKSATDMKCGEGKCGDVKTTETKSADAKCGEGKCGDVKSADTKTKDAKCGEAKCGDSKEVKSKDSKTTDAKCGEGKCGDSKK